MTYEEKLALLDGEDFYSLFSSLNAAPRWVSSGGHQSIQILGFCHWRGADAAHSAVFDPETFKVTCFSECGGGMHLHTWIKKALELDYAQEAKDFLEDWIKDKNIDLSNRIVRDGINLDYKERPYAYERIEPVSAIPASEIDVLYKRFATDSTTLNKLRWAWEDGIRGEVLSLYDVAYFPERDTIILPHHNVRGEIVGLYERSYRPLRRVVKEQFPDIPYKRLIEYPRAKYVPLLRSNPTEDGRTSYSFPNSRNLYGLHLAVPRIRETGTAIIFEGGKSVMLAHQWGIENCVATHTFGANVNHISLLIEQGADTFYLGFDKQFNDMAGEEWDLYEHKTSEFAKRISNEPRVKRVYRICDREGLLEYKDAPVDKGEDVFRHLLNSAEILFQRGADGDVEAKEQQRSSRKDRNSSVFVIKKTRTKEEEARKESLRQESSAYMDGDWLKLI